MTTLVVSFGLAFLISLLSIPIVIRVARRRGLVDAAGASHRKLHAEDVPRLGGVAIVLGFYAPILALSLYATDVGGLLIVEQPALATTILVGGGMVALLGLYDDLFGTSPRLKFAVQIGAALLACALGVQIDHLSLPLLPRLELGWFAVPITVLWIVGITNALNLIDGLDGLAGGVAMFGLAPLLVMTLSSGNYLAALIVTCLAGGILGFLMFNFHPARIFMGDTGSMFLGFVLGAMSVVATQKSQIAVSMLTPVLALGLPLLDTTLAIGRRAWYGQSLFTGDREHIHHRLMRSGLDHRRTVLVLYGFAALLSAAGVAVQFLRDGESLLLFLVSALLCSLLIGRAGYLDVVSATDAGAIRERNTLVRGLVKAAETHLPAQLALDEVGSAFAEIAHAAGAHRVRLVPEHGGPERAWCWQPDADDAVVQRFGVRDPAGNQVATAHVAWPDAASFHETCMPGLEQGLTAIAARLTDRRADLAPDTEARVRRVG